MRATDEIQRRARQLMEEAQKAQEAATTIAPTPLEPYTAFVARKFALLEIAAGDRAGAYWLLWALDETSGRYLEGIENDA